MRHRKSGRKLTSSPSHRLSMLKGMVTDLITHGRIQTTDARAKEIRKLAERVITLSKQGDLFSRRLAARTVRTADALKKLFAELGPRYKDRPGGYTRILKVGDRRGDRAPVSIIELVDMEPAAETKPTEQSKK